MKPLAPVTRSLTARRRRFCEERQARRGRRRLDASCGQFGRHAVDAFPLKEFGDPRQVVEPSEFLTQIAGVDAPAELAELSS